MTSEQWRRVEQLFATAVDLPPEQRSDYLAEACGDEPEVRQEVERLLAGDGQGDTRLRRAVGEAAAQFEGNVDTPGSRRIGPYQVLGELGHGGMGTVYLAARADDAYQKRVAIKIVRFGDNRPELLDRFRNERQILANLDHPNVARLLDGGTTEGGLPYVVMEYVDGEPIGAYCDGQGLSIRNRLKLFRRVCAAVHYAHQNLVVHRDIKPGNILVTAEGEPKLLDFGIAKLLEAGDSASTQTQTATRMMTPDYASPEQIRGERITTASDVYALGVLLYELLTGRRPYRLTTQSPAELERAICEREPDRPSTVRRELRGDLENIVLMAMRKEPARRYASAEQFSEDIRRFLEGYPVQARNDTWGYRAAKFMRRNRAGVAVAAGVAALLVGAVVGISVQARRAAEDRDRAVAARAQAEQAQRAEQEQRQRAETSQTRATSAERQAQNEAERARKEGETARRVSAFLIDLFNVADPYGPRTQASTTREILDRGAQRIDQELKDEPEVRATLKDTIGLVYFSLGEYDRAQTLIEQALKTRQKLFGDNHAQVAGSLHNLGTVLDYRGDYAGAEAHLRRALAVRKGLHGVRHDDVLRTMSNLASVLHQKGNLVESETLRHQILETRKQLHGDNHLDVARSLSALANSFADKGEYPAAEPLLKRALDLYRKLQGEDHLSTIGALNALALLYRNRGDFDNSEPLLRQVYITARKVLGDGNPDVANYANNLAAVLFQRGNVAEAEQMFRQALIVYRKVYGEEHRTVSNAINNLATVLFNRREFDESESLYRQALAVNRRLFGEAHQQVADNLNNLGRVLIAKRDFDKAELVMRQAIESRRKAQGDEHPLTAVALDGLGLVLREKGDFRGAAPLHRQALEIRRKRLPAGSPAIAVPLLGLGQVSMAANDPAGAEPLFREGLELRRKALPKGHWEIAELASYLGGSLSAQQRYEEAEPLLLEAYPVLKEKQGADSRLARDALDRLVALYKAWGKPEKAAEFAARRSAVGAVSPK